MDSWKEAASACLFRRSKAGVNSTQIVTSNRPKDAGKSAAAASIRKSGRQCLQSVKHTTWLLLFVFVWQRSTNKKKMGEKGQPM